MQHNWLGIEGIKIEFYAHDGNAELQDLVNNFIASMKETSLIFSTVVILTVLVA